MIDNCKNNLIFNFNKTTQNLHSENIRSKTVSPTIQQLVEQTEDLPEKSMGQCGFHIRFSPTITHAPRCFPIQIQGFQPKENTWLNKYTGE